ncbi:MAG: hypothetical protein Q9217_002330 [Psora testacea]
MIQSRMLPGYKVIAIALSLLLVSTVIIVNRLFAQPGNRSTYWIPSLKGQPDSSCSDELDWLGELNLTYPVLYARRDILVNSNPSAKRAFLTRVDEKLFPDLQRIDLLESAVLQQHCKDPLILDLPAAIPSAGEASHIIFGISTTLQRIDDSIPQLLRWLPNTNARLFVIVIESEQHDEVKAVEADPGRKAELQARMRSLAMDVTLVEPLELQDSFSEKYFSLIKVMYDNRDDKTQWLSTIDDDTFFPSMPALVSMLSKYDPLEEHYIGGLSEDWWAVTQYGLMAFGGAGIFISLSLAKVMADEYQFCKEASAAGAGDMRVMECIYELTDTKLTNEPSLHQIDIDGDLSGIFESGRLPLSLHHWKSDAVTTARYDLPMMHQVADVCHECFLQRWQFDNDMILANGFSIARYPTGCLKGANMDRLENTWEAAGSVEGSYNHGVDHSLAPTRPKLSLNEEKIQYRLIHSTRVDGGVRQSYYHEGLNGDADTLLELFWRKGDKWERHR